MSCTAGKPGGQRRTQSSTFTTGSDLPTRPIPARVGAFLRYAPHSAMTQAALRRSALQWPAFIAVKEDPSDQWLTGIKKVITGSRSRSVRRTGGSSTGDPGWLAPQSFAVIVFPV